MFGGSKKQIIGLSDQVGTVFGKDTFIKGTVTSQGTLRVDGQLEGDLNTTGDLVIGETGRINAQITARNATVAGTVSGNINITEKLELLPSAKIFGDIKVGTLTVNEGAVFRGVCEMKQGDSIESTESQE
ncbi:MAG TPA: polymer-forming cytoskeletal protein [Methylomusa anaerophila]|uniref:Polymer-forming cytoskeletal n=1 Tax=Methylomusa anaerophila TaxID=1930071 RepID=A0A348AHP4_9FIRM|nr:polymer-forming cytoskeletal protein [Methylomusa anaerophila]BBB90592.1 polymer-forming cytoskeletal [Methylomusa anaerophila]HML88801.1 polymer-forming cytoskeletal protein [Methylomusa anaerophila]